jgi:DNA-binding NarL/FixJ family response regulator
VKHRVVLVDDHTLVREGIRTILQRRGVEVVAEAADGREAIRAVRAHQPTIVLLDISMPELNGLDAIARVLQECPTTRVIILSMHANEEYASQALRLGALGYLVKDSAVDELEKALDTVSAGQVFISAKIGPLRGAGGAAFGSSLDRLTPRQREVLQLIAEGYSTKEIAARLEVSVKTAETHRTQLMERLDIHDVAGLVRFAIRVGLTSADG